MTKTFYIFLFFLSNWAVGIIAISFKEEDIGNMLNSSFYTSFIDIFR